MADSLVAITRIKVHSDPDNPANDKYIEEGEAVSKSKFSDDEWKELVEAGAIGKVPSEQKAEPLTAQEASEAVDKAQEAQSK